MTAPEIRPASERELRLLIKDWRQGRATKTLWEAIQDAYVVVLAVAVFGAMLITLIVNAQTRAATCTEGTCLTARTVLPFAVLAGAIAVTIAAARLFGPVLASAAEGFWLLDAPIDRSKLLSRRLVQAILIAAVGGAAVGALVAALTGSTVVLVVAWAVATGLAAAGAIAFAAAEQGSERTWLTRVMGYLFTLIAVAALVLVVAIASGWLSLTLTNSWELQITVVVGAAGAAILVLAGILAFARLNRIRRTRLTTGGALVSGMAGAMYALDFGLARDIVVERRAIERGHVRSKPGKGVGLSALVRRDLQRLLRTPQAFLPVIGALVVPYASVALGFGAFATSLGGLALFGALLPLLGSLRVLTRTQGLARCLPYTNQEIRKAAMAVAAAASAVWGLLTVPAYADLPGHAPMDAIPLAMLTAAAGLLAAVRWISAKKVDYQAPMVATQAGALPTGMIANVIKGFEVLLLITAPIAFGLPWYVSLLIAFITYWFVMGNFDMEALREQQEEQQKQLAEAKAERKRQQGR